MMTLISILLAAPLSSWTLETTPYGVQAFTAATSDPKAARLFASCDEGIFRLSLMNFPILLGNLQADTLISTDLVSFAPVNPDAIPLDALPKLLGAQTVWVQWKMGPTTISDSFNLQGFPEALRPVADACHIKIPPSSGG